MSLIKRVLFTGLFLLTIDACYSLNIRNVSAKVNIKKRGAKQDTNATNKFYPDWVPFEKNIEDLSELIETKAKPKKRLALPVNFVLKSIVENEDYFDKGLGDGDAEDEFDKKEWSDLNRAANNEKESNEDETTTEASNVRIPKEKPNGINVDYHNDKTQNEEKKEKVKINNANKEKVYINNESNEEDNDEEEAKRKEISYIEIEEKRKAQERKEKILKEVDKLKVKHAQEQRIIFDKIKTDAQEEDEREKLRNNRRYRHRHKVQPKREQLDYDEYEDTLKNVINKYQINTSPKYVPTTENIRTTTTRNIRISTSAEYDEDDTKPPQVLKRIKKIKYNRADKVGKKQSVFKNPRLYFNTDLYNTDDNNDENNKKRITSTTYRYEPTSTLKTSTESILTANSEENVRISLVPEKKNNKEPTAFFPKKRKQKRRRRPLRTTVAPDAYVAETVIEDKTSVKAKLGGKSSSDSKKITHHDTEASSVNAITDVLAASTEHKKRGGGDYHNEKGGAKEHHSEDESEHEEHGKKAYEGMHKDTKTAKGHHDKEEHKGEYEDKDGHDKFHHKEGEHYGGHHHEEKGKKHAKYEESGKHSKGHSTKGSHDIHKKEEYEKKIEFFEEDNDSGEEEKQGGYNHEKGHGSGGHYKKANLMAGHEDHEKGDSGHFGKGGHVQNHKGHRASGGFDAHGNGGHSHHNHEKKDAGKRWMYHHGYPVKAVNLVLVDTRADDDMYGPLYYG